VSLAQAPPETGVLDVSVVLPCYNERDHVELEVKRIRAALEAAGMSYELICVDDGSTDGTREVLEAIAGIRAILLPRNQGSGTARRIGTQQARGRVVVWTDADLTYPNERIPELVAELDDTYDQVVGARRTEAGTYKLARVPAKWAIRKLASYLTNTNIPDLNSKPGAPSSSRMSPWGTRPNRSSNAADPVRSP
jgi:polyisoprenyl-phosphate glycosyltransferase